MFQCPWSIFIHKYGPQHWKYTLPRRVARAPTIQTSSDKRPQGSQVKSSGLHNIRIQHNIQSEYRQGSVQYQQPDLHIQLHIYQKYFNPLHLFIPFMKNKDQFSDVNIFTWASKYSNVLQQKYSNELKIFISIAKIAYSKLLLLIQFCTRLTGKKKHFKNYNVPNY